MSNTGNNGIVTGTKCNKSYCYFKWWENSKIFLKVWILSEGESEASLHGIWIVDLVFPRKPYFYLNTSLWIYFDILLSSKMFANYLIICVVAKRNSNQLVHIVLKRTQTKTREINAHQIYFRPVDYTLKFFLWVKINSNYLKHSS